MRLPGLLFVLTAVALVASGSAGVAQAEPSTPTTVDKNVMVPMRDGVRLATDVYRPTAPGT